MNTDPTLKPDIAALKKRLAEDPGFAAQVTGDRPPTPGCHTPEGCRDSVTGEKLYGGESSTASVEDVEAAARYLRDCAEAEPVATVPHGWKLVPIAPTPEMLATTSWPGCAATDYAHMLAAAPQPPSAQADAVEALR